MDHIEDTPLVATKRDKGFTLVELLIVIVILGILATVTVFAVRGLTDKAQENTCLNDRAALETAVESWSALNGGAYPANEAALVPSVMTAESANWSYTRSASGNGYTLAPAAGASCVGEPSKTVGT